MKKTSLEIASIVAFCTVLSSNVLAGPRITIGEGPNHRHIAQEDIDNGNISTHEILEIGSEFFGLDFNVFDGHGDPARPGINGQGVARGFHRISGTDSLSCAACHAKPFVGGAGDNVLNIFPPFNRPDNIDAPTFAGLNERNTISVFGAGSKQVIAEEMSAELQATREQAISEAVAANTPVTMDLIAKGINFGTITGLPDGSADTSGVDGVDTDLTIKPFNSKGTELNLRNFVIGAMEQHHGIQAAEKFGAGDPDNDGVPDEMTVGDVTATALFQASLPVPIEARPRRPRVAAAVRRGDDLFETIGCASCHTPTMYMNKAVFTTVPPSPYKPTSLDIRNTLPPKDRRGNGPFPVQIYSDLKRHYMGEELIEAQEQGGVDTTTFLTLALWGVGNTGPWMHDGRATTLGEAIMLHGGDASAVRDNYAALPEESQQDLLTFLKSLLVVEKQRRRR